MTLDWARLGEVAEPEADCITFAVRSACGGDPGLVELARKRLGRGPGSDLVFTDPAVSAVHAELGMVVWGMNIVDLSKNGVWYDGVRLASVFVPGRHEVLIGNFFSPRRR